MLRTKVWILAALVLAIAIPVVATQQAAPEKIIQGPVVEGVGNSWAVIAWSTNTGGSSIIRYGTDRNTLSQTAQAPYADNEKTTTQTHRVHLNNLKPGTTYYFVADSGQGEGTGTEAKSSIGQFTTKGSNAGGGESNEKAQAVKIIDGPRVEGVGKDWAVIAWSTNAASSSVIRYGTDQNNLSQTAQSPYVDNDKTSSQTHRVRITNLKPSTTYHFLVDSGQGEGTGTEAKSSVGQFTTKAQ